MGHVGGLAADLRRLKSVPSAAIHRLKVKPMDGEMDVTSGRVSEGPQSGNGRGMSIREASRVFGLHRDTLRKMVTYSVPPGYRRHRPPRKPKLEPFTGVIGRILEDD